jgi:hypothetical protein
VIPVGVEVLENRCRSHGDRSDVHQVPGSVTSSLPTWRQMLSGTLQIPTFGPKELVHAPPSG